jgi:hypothetical protein
MRILAIDPGPEVSGLVGYDSRAKHVLRVFPSFPNLELAEELPALAPVYDALAFEMVACYGMPVGAEVFETVFWAGRFAEIFGWRSSHKVYRKDVKLFLCNTLRASDAVVRQALLDRFARTGGGVVPQIGIKSAPGPLYGVRKHAWSALAVAVTFAHGGSRDLQT